MRSENEIEFLLKSIDQSDKIFFVVSPDFKILAANKQTIEKFNNNFIGRLCHEVIYDGIKECDDCPAVKVIKTRKPTFGDKLVDNENSKMPLCSYFYPIISGEDIDAVAVIELDRPLQEETEEKFSRSNAFQRNLIMSSVDGVIAADIKGKIIMFNDAASEISGTSIDEALETMDIRKLYPGDGAREIMQKLRSDDYGGKGKLKSSKIDIIRKDGEKIPINLNASIVYEGGKEVASIGFFHDMREELKMKSELERTQVQLLQAEKMSSLGKLSAGVAHQLNNPLGGIILYTKLILEDYDLDDLVKDDLNRILHDAQRCRDTVKELLEFARQTSHNIKAQDINEAIGRTLFLLENQTLFQNIDIIKSFDEGLPKVPVDIQQINHVLMNIILNAAQAMDGDGKLETETMFDSRNGKIRIRISDTGPGMTDIVLRQIFDPFFTTKEEGKGTGLGLSMVYGIIEDHGGNITAESKLGEGTSFIIELPLNRKEE